VPSGRIDLTWSVARTQQGRVLALEWKESGGRSPRKQSRSGFGTRLISMVIERQLSGQVQQAFTPKGSLTRLVLPLARKQ
jgi:two-component sensor histidine kinase